jgi:hypothetical protein
VGEVSEAGQTALLDRDRRNEVESQHAEVDEVIVRERLTTQMRVHQAQAAQTAEPCALPAKIGEHELPRLTDDHELDLSASVDQHADLTADLRGALGERTSELGARHAIRRHASSVETLESRKLARCKAEGVSVNHAPPITPRMERLCKREERLPAADSRPIGLGYGNRAS